MAPRILGPRRLNISAPSRSRTVSCEVVSLGATQIQWLRQIGGEADAIDGRKTVVVFDYVFEVISGNIDTDMRKKTDARFRELTQPATRVNNAAGFTQPSLLFFVCTH